MEEIRNVLEGLEKNRYPKFYVVLECEVDCSPSKIRDQYRILSLIHHPDRGGSTLQMSKLNEAYSVLSNPIKRQIYDTLGSDFIIEEIERNYHYTDIFSDYIPILIGSCIVSLLNLKPFSFGGNKRMGFLCIFIYPVVHEFLKSSVSKLFKRTRSRFPTDENNNNSNYFQKIFGTVDKYIDVVDLITELVASFLSTPLEIAGYLACKKGIEIQHPSDYFVASNQNNFAYKPELTVENSPSVGLAAPSIKLWLNVQRYFGSCDPIDILKITSLRALLSIAMGFLGYYQEYCQHLILENQETYNLSVLFKGILIEEIRREREQSEIRNQIGSENANINDSHDNGYYIDETIYENRLRKLWWRKQFLKLAGRSLTFSSFCLPGLLLNYTIIVDKEIKFFSRRSILIIFATGSIQFIYNNTIKLFSYAKHKLISEIKMTVSLVSSLPSPTSTSSIPLASTSLHQLLQ
ncbi:hypothetical protein ACTA71_003821 [Dictyostelium dimigraforme]